jgi:hypothetical protein
MLAHDVLPSQISCFPRQWSGERACAGARAAVTYKPATLTHSLHVEKG